ncbi:hypothetical protein B0J15DRAFT_466831 [Fusarium solani]|uniref:SGNH hydrolase-type esterase domain-containing protein n=1 Tax=Fusarium solani TaxID=169388 RepID=A0A9P9K829_FUSSL|nr:uncharacterized protein B0J15DRAFT_466831 [Fusarium solani]KAH7252987.1 hypothetical protein B0J15DRAFT_466831 [Fusarium solani]
MELSTQHQRRSAGQRWNAWTALMLVLVALSSWVPVSNASIRSPRHLNRREAIADGVDLRVLPIGELANLENKLDFVGRRADNVGMSDPDHEGHRGKIIDEISDLASIGISAAPNIVLLHAGTNDMNKDVDTGNAPARLKKLIDKILKVSPKAVILVSEGKKALVVSMNEAVQLSDIADDLHPNDRGYQKMANEFYDAIQQASRLGWISEPGTPVTPRDQPRRPGANQPHRGPMLAPSRLAPRAYADPLFTQRWASRGVVHGGDCPRDRLHFMDLDGDGLKDYACVDADTRKTKVILNIAGSNGKWSGSWGEAKTIASGTKGRLGSGVRFADLNGDGRDDYIYVHPVTGDITAWINRGEGTGGAPWQWQPLGVIADGIGATNKNLQFVDLNGDHRADLCLVNQDSGEVKAWINNGASIMPDWYRLDTIATGASKAPDDSVILGDFTGEVRADYMMVGADGKVVGAYGGRRGTDRY